MFPEAAGGGDCPFLVQPLPASPPPPAAFSSANGLGCDGLVPRAAALVGRHLEARGSGPRMRHASRHRNLPGWQGRLWGRFSGGSG